MLLELKYIFFQKLPFTDFLNERSRTKCRLQIGFNKDIKLQIVPLYTLCKEYTTYAYEKKNSYEDCKINATGNVNGKQN